MSTYKPHISSFGDASANVIAVTCYVLLLLFWTFGFVLVTVIFLLEKKSMLVRFHALQAIILWVVHIMLGGGLSYESMAAIITRDNRYMSSIYGWGSTATVIIARMAVDVFAILLAVIALSRAYHWQDWKIPFIGQFSMAICKRCCLPTYTGGNELPENCMLEPYSKNKRHHTTDDKSVLVEKIYAYANGARTIGDIDETPQPTLPAAYQPQNIHTVHSVTEDFSKKADAEASSRQPDGIPAQYTGKDRFAASATVGAAKKTSINSGDITLPVVAAPALESTGIDYENLLEPKVSDNPVSLLVNRLFGWLRQANKPLDYLLPAGDPNYSLPPEMRDPPQPEMF